MDELNQKVWLKHIYKTENKMRTTGGTYEKDRQ